MLWKVTTVAFAIGCIALLVLLARSWSTPQLNDPRLYGTWKSDRERTFDALGPQTSDESREKLGALFGKLEVTYTDTNYATKLDDFTETIPYTVLGIDDHSVVIRDDSPPEPTMELLELSSFTKINFEGDDIYWVTTAIGGFTEYFKRVTDAGPQRQRRAEP